MLPPWSFGIIYLLGYCILLYNLSILKMQAAEKTYFILKAYTSFLHGEVNFHTFNGSVEIVPKKVQTSLNLAGLDLLS